MNFKGLSVWIKEEGHFLPIKIICTQPLMRDS